MNTIQEGFKTYCQGCEFKTGCNEEEKKKCYVKYIETQIDDLKKELKKLYIKKARKLKNG